ncbi:hypothetical protein ABK040_002424 [Willaertia magna]
MSKSTFLKFLFCILILLTLFSSCIHSKSLQKPSNSIDFFSFRLPSCPIDDNIQSTTTVTSPAVYSPSSFSFFIITSFFSILFASIIFSFFNSLYLPNLQEKIYLNGIHNTFWIFYFLLVSLRELLNAIHYGKPTKNNNFIIGMGITNLIIHTFTALFLSLCLSYQFRFRCNVNFRKVTKQLVLKFFDKKGKENVMERLRKEERKHEEQEQQQSKVKALLMKFIKFFFSFESISIITFIITNVFIILYLSFDNSEVLKWLLFSFLMLQRVPIIILCLCITFSGCYSFYKKRFNNKNNHSQLQHQQGLEDSQEEETEQLDNSKDLTETIQKQADLKDKVGNPSLMVKILVLSALLLNLPNDIPISYWHTFLTTTSNTGFFFNCTFGFASLMDLFIIFYFLSLILWFIVLVLEFKRFKKDTIALSVAIHNLLFEEEE